MDVNLPEGASREAGVNGPASSSEDVQLALQATLPLGHLTAMFGLSVVFAITLLIGSWVCSFNSAEIKFQAPGVAKYRVDINCDRWVEFANLPSIGKKTAQSIVDYGQEIGGYHAVDQLLEVKGVGKKTLAAIRPYIIPVHSTISVEQGDLPSL